MTQERALLKNAAACVVRSPQVKCAVIEAHRSVLAARGRLVDAIAHDRGFCSANLVGRRLAAQTLAQGLDPF